jgi:hypothetical protein
MKGEEGTETLKRANLCSLLGDGGYKGWFTPALHWMMIHECIPWFRVWFKVWFRVWFRA